MLAAITRIGTTQYLRVPLTRNRLPQMRPYTGYWTKATIAIAEIAESERERIIE